MIDQTKIQSLRDELIDIDEQLAQPEIYASPKAGVLVNKKRALLENIELFEKLLSVQAQIDDANASLSDPELKDLAQETLDALQPELTKLEGKVKVALLPRDENDAKNAIVEIRAGAGGDESSLFSGDLLRMYSRWAETHGLKMQLLSESQNPSGGYKEVILEVLGENAYGMLKYESGVHRVQRIPATENAGRIHTSTATVAVLPEATETDIEINPADIRVDVFRSGGNGGQSVNTTDSAVRITHLPTGIVATCQDEKSQLKNKLKAMNVLRSRLLDAKLQAETKQTDDARRMQIGTGDRSEKIRTYNFPQDRITDHRIGFTTHGIPKVLDGNLDEIFTALQDAAVQKAISEA